MFPCYISPAYARCCTVLRPVTNPAQGSNIGFFKGAFSFINTLINSQQSSYIYLNFYFISFIIIYQASLFKHSTLWWDVIYFRSLRTTKSRTSRRRSNIASSIAHYCGRHSKPPPLGTTMAIRSLPWSAIESSTWLS